MKYTLYNYFDVYGNSVDGYEINNQEILFDDWYIADDCTNQDIINYLYDNGYLTTNNLEKVDIENYGDYMEVYAVENCCPLFGIMPN